MQRSSPDESKRINLAKSRDDLNPASGPVAYLGMDELNSETSNLVFANLDVESSKLYLRPVDLLLRQRTDGIQCTLSTYGIDPNWRNDIWASPSEKYEALSYV